MFSGLMENSITLDRNDPLLIIISGINNIPLFYKLMFSCDRFFIVSNDNIFSNNYKDIENYENRFKEYYEENKLNREVILNNPNIKYINLELYELKFILDDDEISKYTITDELRIKQWYNNMSNKEDNKVYIPKLIYDYVSENKKLPSSVEYLPENDSYKLLD